MMGDNILTAVEAAAVLRTTESDPTLELLLPQVDAYIETATGRDWTEDEPIDETAKTAARMLLVQWHENPGMLGQSQGMLPQGINAVLAQLEAKALILEDEEGS